MSERPSAWLAGLLLRCPQCGKGPVFSGYLRFRERCSVCDADFRAADAGDGPAVFVILIVGAIVAPLLIILQVGLDLPDAISIAIAMGAFDQPTGVRFAKHIFTADKGDYYDIADGAPQNAR